MANYKLRVIDAAGREHIEAYAGANLSQALRKATSDKRGFVCAETLLGKMRRWRDGVDRKIPIPLSVIGSFAAEVEAAAERKERVLGALDAKRAAYIHNINGEANSRPVTVWPEGAKPTPAPAPNETPEHPAIVPTASIGRKILRKAVLRSIPLLPYPIFTRKDLAQTIHALEQAPFDLASLTDVLAEYVAQGTLVRVAYGKYQAGEWYVRPAPEPAPAEVIAVEPPAPALVVAEPDKAALVLAPEPAPVVAPPATPAVNISQQIASVIGLAQLCVVDTAGDEETMLALMEAVDKASKVVDKYKRAFEARAQLARVLTGQ